MPETAMPCGTKLRDSCPQKCHISSESANCFGNRTSLHRLRCDSGERQTQVDVVACRVRVGADDVRADLEDHQFIALLDWQASHKYLFL
jgi:hypothetical protein